MNNLSFWITVIFFGRLFSSIHVFFSFFKYKSIYSNCTWSLVWLECDYFILRTVVIFHPKSESFSFGLQCFDCKPLFASFVCRTLFAIRDTLAVCTLEKISTMTEWTWFELGKFILSAMIVLCGVKFARNNIAIAWRKHRAAHSIWWLAFTIRGSACDTNISCF